MKLSGYGIQGWLRLEEPDDGLCQDELVTINFKTRARIRLDARTLGQVFLSANILEPDCELPKSHFNTHHDVVVLIQRKLHFQPANGWSFKVKILFEDSLVH